MTSDSSSWINPEAPEQRLTCCRPERSNLHRIPAIQARNGSLYIYSIHATQYADGYGNLTNTKSAYIMVETPLGIINMQQNILKGAII